MITGFALLRCLLALVMDLGNDESYYWLYSQQLQWNYFDHPPLVAVWVKIFTGNLLLEQNVFFLRLGSIIGGGLSAWFLFKATAKFHSERAGFFAACLYSTSFYAGITASLYLMPDSPQMVFWTFSLWMVANISADEKNWMWWLLFGIGAGLCIMSKVHGVFLWGGMGLYLLFQKREWLKLPQLYAAAACTLVLISPILIWNIQHDFATYRFHSKRVTMNESSTSNFSLFQEILHQFSFNNPLHVIASYFGLTSLFKKKFNEQAVLKIFTWIGLPLAAILFIVSTFRDTILIHWSGPAYVSLMPLAAVQIAEWDAKRILPIFLRWAMGLYLATVIVWSAVVNLYPGTWGSKNEKNLGYGDLSLDVYGWQQAGKAFLQFYQKEMQQGRADLQMPVVCTYWWGSHIEYYFCKPAGLTMIGLGPIHQIHQYHWLDAQRRAQVNLEEAWCIMPSDDNYLLPTAFYRSIELKHKIIIFRNGKPAHSFRVYRLSGFIQQIQP